MAKVAPAAQRNIPHVPDASIAERVDAHYDEMSAALHDADKLSRIAKVEALKSSIKENDFTEEERAAWGSDIAAACKALEKHAMRRMVIESGERATAAPPTRFVRSTFVPATCLACMVRACSSAARRRRSPSAPRHAERAQRLDTIDPQEGKRYMHQYNFPPFCTGEKPAAWGGLSAARSAMATWPSAPCFRCSPTRHEFPYAIRVVSEVMESNGSSSMASTCGSTLALMDGGVPIKAPVSGIAMGLIKEGDDVVILSDIQGMEDFLGDMDFKVTGTEKGITALQMDNKATGLTFDIRRPRPAAGQGGSRLHPAEDARCDSRAAPHHALFALTLLLYNSVHASC